MSNAMSAACTKDERYAKNVDNTMTFAITTITTPFFNVSVNCYLVRSGDRYILIDTGIATRRGVIEAELISAGCQPGNLDLILLTHGDFDHCGNAAYLRNKFDTKIAMHYDDTGMVERGDMFWNRKPPNMLLRTVVGLFFRLHTSDRCTPDLYIQDGDDLSGYGLDAQVIHIPGHSRGSIGILTTSGDLFGGDLLANVDQPVLWSIIDDAAAARASVEKLKRYPITTVYPGHGKPFPMEQFIKHTR